MSSRAVVVSGGMALVALASCSDPGGAALGVAPPVVGDITGTAAAPVTEASAAPARRSLPRATRKGGDTPSDAAPRPPAANVAAAPPSGGSVALPAGFEPVHYCLMPKLGSCSAYGKNYNKLDAVLSFCGKLGGEIGTYCPSANLVARCKTPADVLTHYYGVGEKKYTREEAEAKCAEKGWEILPLP